MKSLSNHKAESFSKSILEKYFKIDGDLLTVDLYYDTFSMLVDQSIGNDKVEKLNEILFEKIDEVLELVPRKYRISVLIHIKDLEDYQAEEVERIIKENIMLKIYSIALERKKKHITGISLLFGGIVMLLASYFLSRLEWPQIIFDIINISGTLLVWESANITLIERSEEMKRVKQYIKKFKDIQLVTSEESRN